MLMTLMVVSIVFVGCDDDKNDLPNVELAGGCWICAIDGYSEMLTFTEEGSVTTSGVKGSTPWEKYGTYLFENGNLSLNFNDEVREGKIEVKGKDNIAFYESNSIKNYDRRYAPEFHDIFGWNWNLYGSMTVQQAQKDNFVSPVYNNDKIEYPVSDYLNKIKEEILPTIFTKVKFTEDHLITWEGGTKQMSYPYEEKENVFITLNYGTTESQCPITLQIKLFATGNMAFSIGSTESFKLLAYYHLRNFGATNISETLLNEWTQAYADTFSQLLLVANFMNNQAGE